MGECAEFLMSRLCDPNHLDRNGQSPLFYAAQRSSSKCAEVLIASGARVNIGDKQGLTPGFVAARAPEAHGSLKVLLDARSDLSVRSPEGQTAIFNAQSAQTVRMMLRADASVDVRDALGRTALFYAARSGASAVVSALLDGRADASAKDNDGSTCLAYAHSPEIRDL